MSHPQLPAPKPNTGDAVPPWRKWVSAAWARFWSWVRPRALVALFMGRAFAQAKVKQEQATADFKQAEADCKGAEAMDKRLDVALKTNRELEDIARNPETSKGMKELQICTIMAANPDLMNAYRMVRADSGVDVLLPEESAPDAGNRALEVNVVPPIPDSPPLLADEDGQGQAA